MSKRTPLAGVMSEIETLWAYMSQPRREVHADFAVLCGSRDLVVADYAADLYARGLFERIVCSGGVAHQSDLLATGWSSPEARVFADRLETLGVPRDAVIEEARATNTAENITFSMELITPLIGMPSTLLFIHKPFMCLRTHLTAARLLPERSFAVCGPATDAEAYLRQVDDPARLVDILVGDFERVFAYALKGFTAAPDVPADAIAACARLREAGFVGHSIL